MMVSVDPFLVWYLQAETLTLRHDMVLLVLSHMITILQQVFQMVFHRMLEVSCSLMLIQHLNEITQFMNPQ